MATTSATLCPGEAECCAGANSLAFVVDGGETLSLSFKHANGSAARVELLMLELSGLESSPANSSATMSFGNASLAEVNIELPVYVGEGEHREVGVSEIRFAASNGAAFSVDALVVRALAPGERGGGDNFVMPPTQRSFDTTGTPPPSTAGTSDSDNVTMSNPRPSDHSEKDSRRTVPSSEIDSVTTLPITNVFGDDGDDLVVQSSGFRVAITLSPVYLLALV